MCKNMRSVQSDGRLSLAGREIGASLSSPRRASSLPVRLHGSSRGASAHGHDSVSRRLGAVVERKVDRAVDHEPRVAARQLGFNCAQNWGGRALGAVLAVGFGHVGHFLVRAWIELECADVV